MKTLTSKLYGRQVLGACSVAIKKRKNYYYVVVRQGTSGYSYDFLDEVESLERFKEACQDALKKHGEYVSIEMQIAKNKGL